MEGGVLPPEDFLSYGQIEDLLLFGEMSQDREVNITTTDSFTHCSISLCVLSF
jgi:hypothetical protein